MAPKDRLSEVIGTIRAALAALPLVFAAVGSLPDDLHAAEPTSSAVSAAQTPTEMRHEMQDFAQDADAKGIGIFINLQHDATLAQGEGLGEQVKAAFAGRGIPVQYRIVHSTEGTTTDLTFYLRGYSTVVNFADLRKELKNILAHYGDVWRTGTVLKEPTK